MGLLQIYVCNGAILDFLKQTVSNCNCKIVIPNDHFFYPTFHCGTDYCHYAVACNKQKETRYTHNSLRRSPWNHVSMYLCKKCTGRIFCPIKIK